MTTFTGSLANLMRSNRSLANQCASWSRWPDCPGAGQIIEEATSKQLGAMEKLTKEVIRDRVSGGDGAGDGSGLTRARGEAFRQFQSLLFELDKDRKWAGMRRFLTAAGDYLWICPEHHREYDHGLPDLPG